MPEPLVSVILPVYNDEEYLGDAIRSILNQSFKEFELIIIDDNSNDNCIEVAKDFCNGRIKVKQTPKNLGRAGADNYAFQYARGKYIAKMDSDDIALPKRLEKQVSFLESNPEIDIVGSWSKNFATSKYLNKYPHDPEEARCMTLFTLPFNNPTIMMKRNVIESGSGYNENYRQSEDYEFIARNITRFNITNIPEVLLHYRNVFTERKKEVLNKRRETQVSVYRDLLNMWHLSYSEEELRLHANVSFYSEKPTLALFTKSHIWLMKLYEFNRNHVWFVNDIFRQYLARKWFDVCYNSEPSTLNLNRIYQSGELSNFSLHRMYDIARLKIKQLWYKERIS